METIVVPESDLDVHLMKDGFAIARNILSTEDVQKLRGSLSTYFQLEGQRNFYGITQPNAAIEIPEISWLLYHDKILDVVRRSLGTHRVMFTSHCDAHVRTLAQWHKDDGESGNPGSYFGQITYDIPDCRVYKVGVYLQDHRHNRSGLTVRRGSHRYASLTEGDAVYLDTGVGDVVIFDVRLTHRGQVASLPMRLAKRSLNFLQSSSEKLGKNVPTYSQPKQPWPPFRQDRDRMAIFFTFGLPNTFTQNFAVANMARQCREVGCTNFLLPPDVRQIFLQKDVVLAEDLFTSSLLIS